MHICSTNELNVYTVGLKSKNKFFEMGLTLANIQKVFFFYCKASQVSQWNIHTHAK